jgi:hypothetical protein
MGLGGIGGTGQRPPAEFTLAERLRKRTVAGNMLAALYRARRAPRRAMRAARAARSDGGGALPAPSGRRRYRAVYVIPAGPGHWPGLREALDSIAHYEGDDTKVVVVDDATEDCRARVVRSEFPETDVVRMLWPSTGPPRDFWAVARGLRHAVTHYEFDVLGKIDTDALLTGPRPADAARELFERDPGVGMAGTHLVRGDGEPEDYSFDAWVLPHTLRWSRSMRAMVGRAREGGYSGVRVNGIYYLAPAMLRAAEARGDLSWRPPWWTQLGEDFCVAMITLANGYGFGSLGGPGEPLIVAPNFLPLSKEDVLKEGKLLVHSTRLGFNGESEEELYRYFRAARGS